ncbi:MAG: beta-lactamase family protein [Acidobacteriia bacterium]|nr:beta-lactamase family protein [Terriglobia bacterium]
MKCLLLSVLSAWGLAAQTVPPTGQAVAGLEAYDQAMLQLTAKYQIPGAALAVARDGRLVMARGYGYADRDAKTLVQPDSLFRIFSISKPITALATYKLVEQGKLRLDAKAFQILSRLKPPTGQTQDPRLQLITIQHLLDHEGGWDINALGFDPVGQSTRAAQVVGVTPPASAEVVIRYMLGIPLNFDPGRKSVYSNFGYSVLGRVIEEVSGMSYETFVKTNVFGPLGITRTAVGHTLQADRFPGEVTYYFPGLVPSVFPNVTGLVPWPYGGFLHRGMGLVWWVGVKHDGSTTVPCLG